MDLIAELTQRFTELQTLCKALSSDKRDWQQRSDLLHREIERLRSQVQMLERGTSSGDDQVVKDVIAAFEDDYEKLCEVNAVLRKTNEGLEAKATAYERQVNALLDEKQALKESFAKEREVLHQELKDLKKVALEAHEDTTELLRLTPVIERCLCSDYLAGAGALTEEHRLVLDKVITRKSLQSSNMDFAKAVQTQPKKASLPPKLPLPRADQGQAEIGATKLTDSGFYGPVRVRPAPAATLGQPTIPNAKNASPVSFGKHVRVQTTSSSASASQERKKPRLVSPTPRGAKEHVLRQHHRESDTTEWTENTSKASKKKV